VLKQNGAVYSDCAEPHENPNLTHTHETETLQFRSKTEERDWEHRKPLNFGVFAGPEDEGTLTLGLTDSHRCVATCGGIFIIQMTNCAGKASI
jgi:hypothetical protein